MAPRNLTADPSAPRRPWYSTTLAWLLGAVGIPSDAAASIADGTISLFTSKKVAYTAAATFLLAGVVLGLWTLDRANRYVTLVEAALSKSTENTPQSLKALESLILSYVEAESGVPRDFRRRVEQAEMSGAFRGVLTRMHEVLSTSAPAPTASLSMSTGTATSRGPIVTEDSEDYGFLFLPARLLHLPPGDLLEEGLKGGRLVGSKLGIVSVRAGTPSSDAESGSRGEGLETCVVNVNTASAEELAARLELGIETARLLVAYREKNNGFSGADPLKRVPGLDTLTADWVGRRVSMSVVNHFFVLCDDVTTTRRLAAHFAFATNQPVYDSSIADLEAKPEQAYVITDNGLNRIANRRGENVRRYSGQFHAGIWFPGRPYYVGAMNKAIARRGSRTPPYTLVEGLPAEEDKKPPLGGTNGYFYVSEPYMDIGGHGIVITLARAFKYPNHSEGVIGFDLVLSGLQTRVVSLVEQFGGTWAVSRCMVPKEDIQCEHKEGSAMLHSDVKRTLESRLTDARRDVTLPDIAGNLYLLSAASPSGPAPKTWPSLGLLSRWTRPFVWLQRALSYRGSELRFTVPIQQRDVVADGTSVTLLVASINVGDFLHWTATIGAVALMLIGVALTILVGSSAANYKLTETTLASKAALEDASRKERAALRDALSNVSKVMMHANLPYVRLDNDDYILESNAAFLQFLGFAEADSFQSRLSGTRFEQWLDDDVSRREYSRVQKARREGRRVDPYFLSFRCQDGGAKRAQVVSSALPDSQTEADGLPETFGILI
jgi:PAS domain-containing protein